MKWMREMDGENKPQIPLHSTHLSMNTLTCMVVSMTSAKDEVERAVIAAAVG